MKELLNNTETELARLSIVFDKEKFIKEHEKLLFILGITLIFLGELKTLLNGKVITFTYELPVPSRKVLPPNVIEVRFLDNPSFEYLFRRLYALLLVHEPDEIYRQLVALPRAILRRYRRDIEEELDKLDDPTDFEPPRIIVHQYERESITVNSRDKAAVIVFDNDGIPIRILSEENPHLAIVVVPDPASYSLDKLRNTVQKLPCIPDTIIVVTAKREKEEPKEQAMLPLRCTATLNERYPPSLIDMLMRLVIEPWRKQLPYRIVNIMLIGPEGVGKTTLAKTIIHELGYTTAMLVQPCLYRSKWYGESEKKLAELLLDAMKLHVPLIFDNAEFIGSRASLEMRASGDVAVTSEISVLLNYMESNTTPVFILANYTSGIDRAILRHGRIHLVLLLLYPDEVFRRYIVSNKEKEYGVKLPDNVKEEIIRRTELMTPAEIDAIIRYYLLTGNLAEAFSTVNIDRSERIEEIKRYLNMVKHIKNIKILYPKYSPEELERLTTYRF